VRATVDNWLDALAMLAVANGWADVSRRRMIAARDGRTSAWDGRRDHLMAVPHHERSDPPTETLTPDETIALATAR